MIREAYYITMKKLVEIWIKEKFPQVNILRFVKREKNAIAIWPNWQDDLVIAIPSARFNRIYFIIHNRNNSSYCVQQENVPHYFIAMPEVSDPACDIDVLLKPLADYISYFLSEDNPLPILDKPSPANKPIAK